jgi:hypothetical protein
MSLNTVRDTVTNFTKLGLLLLPLMLLGGCADSSTTGTVREYNIRVAIHDNWGPVTLDFPLRVDAVSENDQTTENASDLSPDIRLQLTEGGGTGTMAGADAALKDVTSKLRDSIKEAALERVKEQVEAQKPEEPDTPVSDDIRTETGTYHGRHNGDRPTWYFSKDLKDYPTPIMVDIPGCFTNRLIEHDGVRYESGGLILKQSDVSGRGMAIVAPSSCTSETATIAY